MKFNLLDEDPAKPTAVYIIILGLLKDCITKAAKSGIVNHGTAGSMGSTQLFPK